ncbi:MAG: glycogen debranching N-terminal domain-containing protein [Xanthobacteraceae bacterium]
MPFRVQIGPHQVPIDHGQTVLVSEPDGQINPPSDKGLYFFDTRVISSWTIYANGEPWDLLNGAAITHYASRTYLTNRRIPTADGIIPQCTLGLVISRMISDGMHEDVDITNNSNDCSRARPTERSVCQWPAQLRSRNCLGVHARDETVNWSAGTWVQFAEPCARPHATRKYCRPRFSEPRQEGSHFARPHSTAIGGPAHRRRRAMSYAPSIRWNRVIPS